MTPQLWIQFLSFQDWRLTHPDLTDQEATLLYKAELQLFQNYQDEIRNQTIDRRNTLANDVSNLGNDISNVLIGDPQGAGQIQEGIILTGNALVGEFLFRGLYQGDGVSRIPLKIGDRFRVKQNVRAFNVEDGIYESLIDFETHVNEAGILGANALLTTPQGFAFNAFTKLSTSLNFAKPYVKLISR
jgi:hypothetical protein